MKIQKDANFVLLEIKECARINNNVYIYLNKNRILRSFMIDLQILLPILAIMIALSILLKILLETKKRKNLNQAVNDSFINKYEDLNNLIYLLIIDNEGGVPAFHKTFGENNELEEKTDLFAGFIHAVTLMGKEIGTNYNLCRNEYQDRYVIIIGGEYCRFISIFKKAPSTETENSLLLFLKKFEKKFHSKFVNFKGLQFEFDEIKDILDSTLEIFVIDELDIFFNENEIEKHMGLEKSLLNTALQMKNSGKTLTMQSILDFYCLKHHNNVCYTVSDKPEYFKTLVGLYKQGLITRKRQENV